MKSTSDRLKSHHNESCIGGLSERLLLSSLVTLNMEWISLCLNRASRPCSDQHISGIHNVKPETLSVKRWSFSYSL